MQLAIFDDVRHIVKKFISITNLPKSSEYFHSSMSYDWIAVGRKAFVHCMSCKFSYIASQGLSILEFFH